MAPNDDFPQHSDSASTENLLEPPLALLTARPSDLSRLYAALPDSELKTLLGELMAASVVLSPPLAEVLVAASIPGHIHAPMAVGVIAEHLDAVAAIATPGGTLVGIVEWIRGVHQTRQVMLAEARPAFEQLLREASHHATRLREQGVDEASLLRAAGSLPPIDPGTMVPELVLSVKRAAPLERLLLALALRSALAGKEEEKQFGAPVRQQASESIYDLGVLALLPLRLRLADEAIEMAGPHTSLARLYLQRANTMRAIEPDALDKQRIAFGLAARSALLEGAHGDFAMAIAALGKLFARAGSPEERESTLRVAIPEAMKRELSEVERACLLQAKGQLLRPTDPLRAAEAYEEAIRILPPADPLTAELAAELVSTLVDSGGVEEAINRGHTLLAHVSSQSSVGLGMLHGSLGKALMEARRFQEGHPHLESSLALFRGGDWALESLTRCYLIELAIRLNDHKLAEEHLRVLRARESELDTNGKQDLERIETAVIAEWGPPGEYEARLQQQGTAAFGEHERTRNLLELLSLKLGRGEVPGDTEVAIRQGLALSPDAEIDRALDGICCNSIHAQGAVPRELLLTWARERRRPAAIARLLQGLDRAEEARAELRSALGDTTLPKTERTQCVYALLTLLGGDGQQNEERLRLCDELEHALDEEQDEPCVRLDLAQAFLIASKADPRCLFHAWKNGLRGLEQAHQAGVAEHGTRLMCRILSALLRTSSPRSDEAIANLAGWLLQPHDLPADELAEAKLRAAEVLLRPGPFVHDKVLEVASSLATAKTPQAPELAGCLRSRLGWIVERRAGKPSRHPSNPSGPLDSAPDWLVQLVLGGVSLPEVPSLGEGLSYLHNALTSRPDEADRVLAVLVFSGAQSEEREAILEAVYRTLHSIPPQGDLAVAWPLLRKTVEAALSMPTPVLREIALRLGLGVESDAAEPASLAGKSERAQTQFEAGVALLNRVRQGTSLLSAEQDIRKAREHLSEAVMLARKAGMPQLCDYIVSEGNAWRLGPRHDVERALSLYEEALSLSSCDEQSAKIWKVQADALCVRGDDDDLRRATSLLERSARIRKGLLRAETLLSAARVARLRPDFDELQRLATPARFLMDAAREHSGVTKQAVDELLQYLGGWERLSPSDTAPGQLREELARIYPEQASEIRHIRSTGDRDRIREMLDHPSAVVFVGVRGRLATPEELRSAAESAGIRGSAVAHFTERAARECLLGRPGEVKRLLSTLGDGQEPTAMPGVLAAKALLLAHLARQKRAKVISVRQATERAIKALPKVKNPHSRAMLLRELAELWSPNDHSSDPVRDFGLAVRLLRECVDLEGGESTALPDTIAFLARALRYSAEGNLRENLLECRRLYQLLVDQRVGGADLQASVRANLAEAEAHMGEGTREERYGRALKLLGTAAELAQSPGLQARIQSQLAWEQTQLATALKGSAREEGLRAALQAFDAVDVGQLEPHAQSHWKGNRAICIESLNEASLSRAEQIGSLRQRLAEAVASDNAYAVAMAQHNLASALLFGPSLSFAEVREGLLLSKQAAAVRSLLADARHHWETSFNAGLALRQVLPFCRDAPWDRLDAWNEARRWLRQALAAARVLGPGEELTNAALELARLACSARSASGLDEVAQEAWQAVREAGPWLVLDRESREREALVASEVAYTLALRMAEETLPVAMNSVSFVLQGERADTVVGWMVRAQSPSRRPLYARIARPYAAPAAQWADWEFALRRRAPKAMGEALRALQAVVPTFLGEDGDLASTSEWLAARPGSVAVHVSPPPSSGPWLVAILLVDKSGRLQQWILGLAPTDPPQPVRDAIEWRSSEKETPLELQKSLVSWLRLHVVEPILRFLGERPAGILWVPGRGLRRLAPSMLWPGIPVAMATALELPTLRDAPGRARSTLVGLVDPGTQGNAQALGSHGMAAFCGLTELARQRGRVRQLASVGARFGRDLLGEHREEVRNTPASATDVLEEAAEHDVIVLIAHGTWQSPEDAWLLCLDADGREDRLDVARLAATPGRLTGATVVLLSCESGQLGPGLAEPGGIAGTLLAAGARCVVAPLRPVLLSVAQQSREAVVGWFAAPWGPPGRGRGRANSSAAGRRVARSSGLEGPLAAPVWVGE